MADLITQKTPLAIISDFDGTITEIDVIDGIVLNYSLSKRWVELEKRWAAGEISSDECMWSQLEDVRITEEQLNEYVDSIQLDPGFRNLYNYANGEKIPFIVLSDGFDLLIRRIFLRHSIRGIVSRCNRLVWEKNRLIPSYPYKQQSCSNCAHCKRSTLQEYRHLVDHYIFIGDGTSDRCAVEVADTVFAKAKLADYCTKKNIPFIPYRTLEDVALMIPNIQGRLAGLQEGIR